MANITTLTVNERSCLLNVGPEVSLLSVFARRSGLDGTKYGLANLSAAACTVLVDVNRFAPVSLRFWQSCRQANQLPLKAWRRRRLHPLQRPFLKADAMQCGY